MKLSRLVLLIVLVLLVTTTVTVSAGSAYNSAFTTSITYQNVGNGLATIVFMFYPENDGTGIPINRTLAQGGGSSIYIGSLTEISSPFNGSVVMSSDQPVVATMVQIASDAAVKNRPLSNGFSSGSPDVLLATVLKNTFGSSSRFSVQNASSGAVDLTITFFNADNPAALPIEVTHSGLPVGAAKYFDLGQLPEITAGSFNGSATISAVAAGTSTPADIVASVLELNTVGVGASSFEGVSSGSSVVYMPSALCNAFGGQNSAYAVQNTSQTTDANVTVTFSSGKAVPLTILPGTKQSVQGCAGGNVNGFSGSATITSTGGAIVVIGKVFGTGLSTAFVGAPAGDEKLALPYVRWSESQWANGARQRAFIAIQNIGGPLNASDVVLSYLNKDGQVVGTHALGALSTGQKLNSNASAATVASGFAQSDLNEFGYIGGFGGSVIIQGPGGSQLVAVVRVASNTGGGLVGEDYNGIPVN
jgi:hypothetical protein